MKYLLILFIVISNLSLAQFKVSDNSNDWVKIGNSFNRGHLFQRTDKTKARFKGVEVNSITEYEFSFSTDDKTLDELYILISDKLKNNIKEEVTLDFKEGKMFLNFDRAFGRSFVQFGFENTSLAIDKNSVLSKKYTLGFNQKEIDKLFGKR